MERIYAPWRSKYITQDRTERAQDGCPFCVAFESIDDASHYILARSEHTVTMLNLYPYTSGHLMVLPVRHCGDLALLSDTERNELFAVVAGAGERLKKAFPSMGGLNVGINIGAHGGGGIPEHLHVHVVPRWRGEGGFLLTIAETVVISRSLDEVYSELRPCFLE